MYGCLDWGNGHVARSVPLIRQLIVQGNKLTLWCSEKQRVVFESFGLPVSYRIGFTHDFTFRGDGNFRKELLRNAFGFAKAFTAEQKAVEAFVSENAVDCIISDHRYGLRSRNIPSVFVTHQVKLPSHSGLLAQLIHRKWMKRFVTVWIMDTERNRLAGELSAPVGNCQYIGHSSRFSELPALPTERGSIVAVISGPEPYAEQFYRDLVEVANHHRGNWQFVCPAGYRNIQHDFPVITNWSAADEAIRKAEWIVSRNGYSTLMDLTFLQKKAVLIPTPGQLEQEYLEVLHGSHERWKMIESTAELKRAIDDNGLFGK